MMMNHSKTRSVLPKPRLSGAKTDAPLAPPPRSPASAPQSLGEPSPETQPGHVPGPISSNPAASSPTLSGPGAPDTRRAEVMPEACPPSDSYGGRGMLQRAAMAPPPEALAGIRLILFRAPSGYGKTVAMGQLRDQLEARGRRTAWATPSAFDQSPGRLMRQIGTAIARLETATATPAPAPSASLYERVAALQAPFALFIDEAEVIRDEAALDSLRELLAQLPPNGLLVVGTQRILPLALTRLRLRGHLLEFRPTELRFTPAETEAFLTGIEGHRLGPEDLARIHAKTEGWPAAVRMVSAALRQQGAPSAFIARFSGSDLAIGEYLTEEFLSELPADLWHFLLCSSILQELTPALCQAICPELDAAALLAELASSNVLISRSDTDGEALRYHNLLLGYLQGQLRLHLPQEIAGLHRRAARWFEANGRLSAAIEHSVQGGDFPQALALLARHGPGLLERGRVQQLSRWFDAIPEAELQRRPALAMMRAWAMCFIAGPEATQALLEAPWLQAVADPAILAERACIMPMILAMQDNFIDAEKAGQQAEAHFAAASPYAQTITRTCMANIQLTLDRPPATPQAAAEESPFNVMYSETVEGLRDLHENRFLLAKARFRIATQAQSPGLGQSGNVWAGIPYALTLYEGGDLAAAAQSLRLQLPMAMAVGLIDHVIVAASHLSRIAAQEGEMDQALEELVRLERYGLARNLPRVVAGALLARSRLFLAQGNLRAAADQLRRAQDEALWGRIRNSRLLANDLDTLALGQIRLDLHAGRGLEALKLLRAELSDALARRRNRRALVLQLLEAAALQQTGAQAEAFRRLASALPVAAREDYHRLLVDEGAPLAAVLHAFADHGAGAGSGAGAAAPLRRAPRLADWLARLLAAMAAPDEPAPTERTAPMPLEALTPKELQVLHYLAEGYSNAAMAEKLFVSDSTVRTHLRNISGKLGTDSRSRAVAVARQHRLIP